MAAVRHLGINVSSYKTTHISSVAYHISVLIFLNVLHSFKDMGI